jgi:cysteine-S-conjugate beta-lyase
MGKNHRPETQLVHAGRKKEWTHLTPGRGVVNPPVWHASTIVFDTLAEFDASVAAPDGGLYYGRRGTPTTWALESALNEMEPGAAGTQLFPSGVAAIAASLLAVASPGDHILVSDSVYEPTRTLCEGLLTRLNIGTTYFPPTLAPEKILALALPSTTAIFLESPGSLTFELQDVPAISALAHARNIKVVLDNTYATSLYFKAIEHGADLSIQSLTKYVVGHSDAMMGAVTASARGWKSLRSTSLQMGQCAAPDDAFLALRGLRTLAVRLKQHDQSARTVAAWLENHAAVEMLYHPAFATCPGHAIWSRDFSGASGLFSILLKPAPRKNLADFIDHLAHFKIGFSWGGYESLILVTNVAPNRTAEKWKATGPLLRLHIGLENAEDLIADLDAGLQRYLAP